MRSRDGSQALIVAHAADDGHAFDEVVRHLIETLRGTYSGPLKLELGGEAVSYVDVTNQLAKDVATSEMIAMPVILLLLVLVFGSLVAAGLPLIIGICSIVGTMGLLTVLAHFTTVSNFALNLTTILGLGLAIDYSLFVVTRFREERAAGLELDDAIIASVRTAGRTVVFSAVTVALSMSAMLAFPIMALRSIAYACLGVVAIAAIAAIVILPALLKLLGHRIDSLDLRRALRLRHASATPLENRFWFRSSQTVMRRPLLIGGAVLFIVLLLGVPFTRLHIGITDDRAMPTTVESRQVGDTVRDMFPAQPTGAMDVVISDGIAADRLDGYAAELSRLPHVVTVTSPEARYVNGRRIAGAPTAHPNGTHLTVLPDVDPYSTDADELLEQIRHTPAPGAVLVGGLTAENVDTRDALTARIPLAAGLIVVTMFVLLFAFTGSAVLPLESARAQSAQHVRDPGCDGVESRPCRTLVGDFTEDRALAAPAPVLMFCLTFGLSMDYEIFFLSRITEEYRIHGDTTAAVKYGLQRVGPVVTAAATIMSIVCIAMATSQIPSSR